MKICFISPKAYPLFNPKINATFGGSEVQIFLMAKEIARDNNNIHVVVADYGQKPKEVFLNVTLWKSLNFKEIILKQGLKLFKIIKCINADVYIQRAFTPFSGIIALWCKWKKKKFVYMVASDIETDNRCHKRHGLIRTFFFNLVFRYANLIIVQHQFQKRNLLKNKGRNSAILRVGIPIGKNIKRKRDYILWVGRSEKLKKPEKFLRLVKINANYNFIMICPQATNKKEYWQKIKDRATKFTNLQFIDYVPFNKIDRFFQNAKIFVNTSEYEGFPSTFVQALKNSVPILSLNVNPEKFLEKYRCGFFCKNNLNIMNDCLKKLLNNNILYQEMSNNAYHYAKNNHNVEVNAGKLLSLIKTIK